MTESDNGAPTLGTVASLVPVEETRATDFRLTADVIGGGLLSLDDELATRPVALWFWAPG